MNKNLDELLQMMREDAAQAASGSRPPPIPQAKPVAIDPAELESLDDGPVLTEAIWPPVKAKRRGPPPPPPGRRARGTAPLSADPIPSALMDLRAMASAYQIERAQPEIIDATPTPILAEGTRPLEAIEAEPELELEPDEEPRRPLPWAWIAGGAAVLAVLGTTSAIAVKLMGGAPVAAHAAGDQPEMNQLEPALAVTVPAEPALTEPALTEIEPALAETEPAVAESSMEMKVFNLPTVITEPSGPIERDLAPDPALLADGCYDAACMTGSDEAEAAPAPAPVKRRPRATIEVPARLQTRPSNGDIAHAVVAVQDQIDGCGDLFGTRGTVPLKVVVAPSGAIKSVAVKQGSERFRSCVSDALRRARTPASQVGTTASFSILVR